MSYGSKQRRKANRGNLKAIHRLNLLEAQEDARIQQHKDNCLKASISRVQYEKQNKVLVASHVERTSKSINGKHKALHVVDKRKFKQEGRTYDIDRETWSPIRKGKDCFKTTGLNSAIINSTQFMDSFEE